MTPATLPPGVTARDVEMAAAALDNDAFVAEMYADDMSLQTDTDRKTQLQADAAGARRLAEWLQSLAGEASP